MPKNVIRLGLSSAKPLNARRITNTGQTVRTVQAPLPSSSGPSKAQAYCPKCVRVKS